MYSVETCFPGCLPEGDEPVLFETLAHAREYAKDVANEYREAGCYVKGNCRDGYWIQHCRDSFGGWSVSVVPA